MSSLKLFLVEMEVISEKNGKIKRESSFHSIKAEDETDAEYTACILYHGNPVNVSQITQNGVK